MSANMRWQKKRNFSRMAIKHKRFKHKRSRNAMGFKMASIDRSCSSLVTSSCENSFRSRPPSHPLQDFSGDFSDLDGVVEQRQQDMMESSSSDSQTPDDDKRQNISRLENAFLISPKREVSVHAVIHQPSSSQKQGATLKNGSVNPTRGATPKVKSYQPKSIHIILIIYIILIIALEHRLNSLISVGEQIRNSASRKMQEEIDADMYWELSNNLLRLEKIKNNLWKLLKTT